MAGTWTPHWSAMSWWPHSRQAAPLLRRGGHSQGWDAGADALGAFFARLMVAVDFKPGFEQAFAAATPLARYTAFVRDADRRRRAAGHSASFDDDLGRLVRHEADRLKASAPTEWDAAGAFLDAALLDMTFGRGACPPEHADRHGDLMLHEHWPEAPTRDDDLSRQ